MKHPNLRHIRFFFFFFFVPFHPKDDIDTTTILTEHKNRAVHFLLKKESNKTSVMLTCPTEISVSMTTSIFS